MTTAQGPLLVVGGLLWAAVGTSPLQAQMSDARLAALGEGVQIGQLEGSEDTVLGLIVDGLVGADFVVLADSRFQQVRKYSFAGRLLARTGRGGRGPGEFYVLTSIAPLGSEHLAVLDAGNRRISVYSMDLTLEYEIPLDLLASDICAIGERLFVQGYVDGATIHEVSAETRRVIRSFGSPPKAIDAPPVLQASALRNAAEAALVCDATREMVIEVHRSTRSVRAFGTDGGLLWEAILPGYREVTPQMTKRGTLALMPDPKTNTQHYLAAAALTDAEHLLVQHAVISHQAPEVDSGELDGWLIDVASGLVRATAGALPRLLDRAHGRSLYAANLPFPQARIVRETGAGGR